MGTSSLLLDPTVNETLLVNQNISVFLKRETEEPLGMKLEPNLMVQQKLFTVTVTNTDVDIILPTFHDAFHILYLLFKDSWQHIQKYHLGGKIH